MFIVGVAAGQFLGSGGGTPPPPGDATPSTLVLTSYTTTSNGSEDLLIYLPEGYGDTPGKTYPLHMFFHGDGATGSFLDRTGEVMTDAGGNLYTHVCDNPALSGNRRVFYKSVVIKVAGVEVARCNRTMNGTTATFYSTGAISGITGTINIAQYPGSQVSVQFPSAPGGTVTIDYQMSKLFETGLPYYLNAGAYDWEDTVVAMVQKGASGTFYSINDHYLELKAFLTANYSVNTTRLTVSGISRGGVFLESLAQSTYRSEIAAFIQLSGLSFNLSGITADYSNKGVMVIAGQSEGLDGYSVPNGSVLNTFGAVTNSKFYPGSIMVQGGRHNGGTWNTYCFDISSAPFDFRDWLYVWSLDPAEQTELFVDLAERRTSIDHWREAKRVVYLEPAGAAKTAWEARLAARKTVIDAGKKRWIFHPGATADTETYLNMNYLNTNFQAGTTFSSLKDDNNNTTGVGFTIVNQMASTPTNRFASSTRGSCAQFGFTRTNYNEGANLHTTVTTGQFKLTGLDNAKTYKFKIYISNGSTSSAHIMSISVTIGSTTKTLFTTYTNRRTMEFTGLTPSGGEIVVNMYANGDTNSIAQVFQLEEQ